MHHVYRQTSCTVHTILPSGPGTKFVLDGPCDCISGQCLEGLRFASWSFVPLRIKIGVDRSVQDELCAGHPVPVSAVLFYLLPPEFGDFSGT
jgi:hypothetical protein